MNLTIDNIRKATDEEWDATWSACEYATYFHSREWAEIWRVYSKGAMLPTPQFVTFSDGNTCLLPISSRKSFFGLRRQYLSSPAGTFGGWISNDQLLPEHARVMANHMTSHSPGLSWRMNPYDPNVRFLLDRPRLIAPSLYR